MAWFDHECRGVTFHGTSRQPLSWFGGKSAEQTLDCARHGSREYLDRASSLMDRMQEHGLMSEGMRLWQSSVVGSFPSVPLAVMGLPESMMSVQETEIYSTLSPIKIVVSLSASMEVSADAIAARGVAILALVMALQQTRHVDLYVCNISSPNHNGRAQGTLSRIETTPLDLDRATYMLCDVSYYRGLCMAAACQIYRPNYQKYYGGIGWSWNRHGETEAIRDMLALESHDVYMPGIFITNEKYINDPISWIKEALEKIKAGESIL